MATLETWNGRTAGQTDADSPQDTTLFDGVRKDLDHLRQVLYGNNEGAGTYYTPAWGHKHDGSDSAFVTSVADGAITPVKLSAQSAGDYLMINNSALKSTVSTTYVKVKEIKVAKSGTYRVKFTLTANGGTGPQAYGQIYKNGAAVGTERTTTSSATYSEDISSISAGDLIQIYAKKTVDTNATEVSAFKLCGLTPGDFGYNETY